ncbi:MAG: LamG-like jellyroll fold domain-containing protein [Candidatus Paceibacterota bacterium]|jgi:prepilin-type N-terminal cleavage/methylation domain-containing protein
MQSKNNQKPKFQKAFTLIELLVVIAIIGILAGMVVVNMSGATEGARIAKSINFASSIQRIMATSLGGEWNFDGQNANDSSGNNNNGTASGAVATATTPYGNGAAGQYAMSFDGINDYVSVLHSASISLSNTFTVSVWIKTNAAGRRILIKEPSGGGVTNYSLQLDSSGYLGGGTYDNLSHNSSFYNTAKAVNDGNWHHAVMVRDGVSKIYIYVDSVMQSATDTTVGNTITNSGNFIIGNRNNVSSYFNGLIDEVRIYSAALPSSAIREQYVAGLDKLLAGNQITQKDYQKRIAELNSTYATNE